MKGYLSLGSNLGDRMHYLEAAVSGLKGLEICIVKVSDVYETRAFEVSEIQGPYLNMALEIECRLTPHDLLDVCHIVENALGRVRSYPHAPRTIDIDILLLDGVDLSNSTLTIPHPRLEQRAFVIHPLAQIAPQLILPSGRSIMEVKKALGYDEIMHICPMPY